MTTRAIDWVIVQKDDEFWPHLGRFRDETSDEGYGSFEEARKTFEKLVNRCLRWGEAPKLAVVERAKK